MIVLYNIYLEVVSLIQFDTPVYHTYMLIKNEKPMLNSPGFIRVKPFSPIKVSVTIVTWHYYSVTKRDRKLSFTVISNEGARSMPLQI